MTSDEGKILISVLEDTIISNCISDIREEITRCKGTEKNVRDFRNAVKLISSLPSTIDSILHLLPPMDIRWILWNKSAATLFLWNTKLAEINGDWYFTNHGAQSYPDRSRDEIIWIAEKELFEDAYDIPHFNYPDGLPNFFDLDKKDIPPLNKFLGHKADQVTYLFPGLLPAFNLKWENDNLTVWSHTIGFVKDNHWCCLNEEGDAASTVACEHAMLEYLYTK
jgi:hypothetical protein